MKEKTIVSKTFLLISVSALILQASPALATEQMSLEAIQAQLQMLSAQVDSLSRVVDQQNKVIADQATELEIQKRVSTETLSKIQPAASAENDVKISMNPSPKIESADGHYSFQPFGRVHLDVTGFDDDKKDHASNANFRRARLGFKGKLGEDLKYKSEFDFAEEGVNLKEVSLTYTGLDTASIIVGHTKPSFGMEQETSSNTIQTIERSAPTNIFTRDHEIGLNIKSGGENWSLAGGVFNEDAGNEDTGEDEDITFDARGSVNILGLANKETKHVLHLGAGVSHRRPTGTVQFAAKPAGDGDNIIDTGALASVDTVNLYGLEVATSVGPVSIQGEYFMVDVDRSGGNRDVDLDGYYAQIGWFITGETRPYRGYKGSFGRIKPTNPFSLKNGQWGAWELVAHYENTDLNDVNAGVTGGELKNTTLGINWHLSNHVRVMANIVDVNTDSNAVVADDDPTIYNFRGQWDF